MIVSSILQKPFFWLTGILAYLNDWFSAASSLDLFFPIITFSSFLALCVELFYFSFIFHRFMEDSVPLPFNGIKD